MQRGHGEKAYVLIWISTETYVLWRMCFQSIEPEEMLRCKFHVLTSVWMRMEYITLNLEDRWQHGRSSWQVTSSWLWYYSGYAKNVTYILVHTCIWMAMWWNLSGSFTPETYSWCHAGGFSSSWWHGDILWTHLLRSSVMTVGCHACDGNRY